MVEVVTSVGLPIDEKLMIKKNRIMPCGKPDRDWKRISIVTGIHGDELKGQYVCYELQRRIVPLQQRDSFHLSGAWKPGAIFYCENLPLIVNC